jgi:hypothetical protein
MVAEQENQKTIAFVLYPGAYGLRSDGAATGSNRSKRDRSGVPDGGSG